MISPTTPSPPPPSGPPAELGEHEVDDQPDDAEPATAERNAAADPAAASTASAQVLDFGGIQAGIVVESHPQMVTSLGAAVALAATPRLCTEVVSLVGGWPREGAGVQALSSRQPRS